MPYQQKQVVKLSQEQSAVLFSITGWTPTSKDIPKRDGSGTWNKKYEVITFNDSTLEAQNILAAYGLGLYDKAEDSGGVFRYTIGPGNTLEKEVIKKGGSWTVERKAQRNEDEKGLEGPIPTASTINKQEYWDKRQEEQKERDKGFQERHEESQMLFRALLDAVNINTESNNRVAKSQEDANRLKQIELGQAKE